MFEKPEKFKIAVPEEFIARSRRNQIEAVKRGDSWPTPEGAEDADICNAFEHYLSTAPAEDLHNLSTQLKEVGNSWATESATTLGNERKRVFAKTDPARRIASLAAVVTFIPLGLVSAIGVKVVLNSLISTIERYALADTIKKSDRWIEIKNHLEQLQELVEEEESGELDTIGDREEYREAA
jgi:hypothetical protein